MLEIDEIAHGFNLVRSGEEEQNGHFSRVSAAVRETPAIGNVESAGVGMRRPGIQRLHGLEHPISRG